MNLGADALGLVFHPASPRAVNPDSITDVLGNLPAFITVVGLFVNPVEKDVHRALQTGRIQCLQFHGEETPQFCQSFGVPFIKAIRVRDLEQARRQVEPFGGYGSVILDSYVKGVPGGTGAAFDWSIAEQLVADGGVPIILAGGLTPENVSAAVARVSPYAVDVSSGVEREPGIKDPEKLRHFFAAVYN